jgi:NAD(P)-dependent dehydrogenase (short-subunit alcohol dehydrogenase family)
VNAAIPDLTGKVAVVTGATGGMGQIIAADLVRAGAHVVTVARNPARADALRVRIGSQAANRLEVITGDLSQRADVVTAAKTILDRHDQIHILINNAGAHYSEHRVSTDGIEMHIALDYLAGYGLTILLDVPLRRGQARVVNVASDTLNDTRQIKLAGKPRPATLDLAGVNDLAELNPAAGFAPFEAYARAKLMTVTAGYALARNLAADGVTVNALHTIPTSGSGNACTSFNRVPRLATSPHSAASRAPALPASASPMCSNAVRHNDVRRACLAVTPSICSANVPTGHVLLSQKNRRIRNRSTTGWPATGPSATLRS